MPMLDHFHPPLHPLRSWESFHSRWANSMADAFQRILPPRYFAEVQIHLGTQVEADVAEFEQSLQQTGNGAAGGAALQTYAPPAAVFVLPAVFPDDLEVHVRDEREDARLVGVVELVSPRNKDRVESRRAFAAKCLAYLQRGIGVMVVDIVTSRGGNMHNELISLMALGATFLLAAEVNLYAVSYHPSRHAEKDSIAVRPEALAVGATLPTLPLALRGFGMVPVDLEATYSQARQRSRI
jgi:hypothetical protein